MRQMELRKKIIVAGTGNDIHSKATMLPVLIISLATFIIFFQGLMVAPLLPMLSAYFNTSVRHVSFIEPSYLLGYGLFTLFYAPLSDRLGRFKVIILSLLLFTILTLATTIVKDINQMILLRLLTGMGAAGVAPTTISWISDTFPYERRGYALGIFFGGMAGGTAFGSSVGALFSSLIGWKWLFVGVAAAGLAISILIIVLRNWLFDASKEVIGSQKNILSSFHTILSQKRARWGYSYVMFNGMFHSGIFAWLGYFFYKNYGSNEMQIGLTLLGYGIPGLLLGPFLGKLADRYGRSKIIPLGIFVGSLAVLLLSRQFCLAASCMLVTLLSLGFDLSHPLFAAIITTYSTNKGRQRGSLPFSCS
ncbi:MFS transporter [Chitinophaga polysaccharea]|uniref:MFS transporter n=1 Tax=Chitinophaga polysaccharea TaxID=1293035 RepID=UPI001C8D0113|nr:MFS transporter [Chitinophaga polysaccharea]